ncbi:helix-turn-helix domain-containing protein [Streptomyces sp. NPDC051315]|uniref:helix-turn-helix domain-containing protein n=1 Tax=Streptomyces sp. NPDC051315 TaxID=3365650 RepID=UPI0037A986AD
MDTRNPSAPAPARSGLAENNHPNRGHRHSGHGGLVHENARHTERFTVIGNHLAQHEELSLLAIGLGVHIQSLPKGARVDIKSLAARFPEGATRIAAALRELETHGYLRRTRERVPGGRIVTRTVSCNRPGHRSPAADDHSPSPPPPRKRPAPRKALPAVPQPSSPAPALLQTATEVLVGLRRHDPRLLLSATDAEHLTPGVAAWLERDLTPTAVRHALTSDLPAEPLRRPAALLAHRLAAQLPPPPPFRPPAPPAPEPRHPLRCCQGCGCPFRSPDYGYCPACQSDPPEAA